LGARMCLLSTNRVPSLLAVFQLTSGCWFDDVGFRCTGDGGQLVQHWQASACFQEKRWWVNCLAELCGGQLRTGVIFVRVIVWMVSLQLGSLCGGWNDNRIHRPLLKTKARCGFCLCPWSSYIGIVVPLAVDGCRHWWRE